MNIVEIETLLVVATGISAIIGLILAVSVFVKIIEVRDRRRASYRLVGAKDQKTPSDITDPTHTVKLIKTRKGYRLDFYDGQGQHFYSVDLEKVDRPGSK